MGDFNQDRRKFINKERISPAIVLDIGDAQEKISIPFVLTVMSQLSGTAISNQPGIDKRELHQVLDRNSFNKLFTAFAPEIRKFVKNRMEPGKEDLEIKLAPRSMSDFTPEQIVQQVPALKAFLEERNKLQLLRDTVGADPEKKKVMAKLGDDSDLKKAITGSSGS